MRSSSQFSLTGRPLRRALLRTASPLSAPLVLTALSKPETMMSLRLQTRKLRHREVNQLVQSCPMNKWWNWDLIKTRVQ